MYIIYIMVKIQRLITIDSELNEKLKGEENASALINSLLISHFDYLETDNEQLLNSKKLEKEHQREIIDKELEHITDKLIIINQRKREQEVKKEYKERLDEIKQKTSELMEKWRNEELQESEYWDLVTPLQTEKNKILENIRKGV